MMMISSIRQRTAYNLPMTAPKTLPQRASLRFCKAFFEVGDVAATHERLLDLGAQELSGAPGDAPADRWYWWHGEPVGSDGACDAFLLRLRAARLVLEGATAGSVGRGWRTLDQKLRPHARARVAARDDLARFVPGQGRHTSDQPETWNAEHEAKVLAEFYAAFAARWARQPHARLDGMSPLEAVRHADKRELVDELLARLARIEEERRQRGIQSFAVEDLRRAVFGDHGGEQ